jgi:hypothetical protein
MVLNPAPAQDLPEEIYPLLLAITPNETETELLTGIAITEDPGTRARAAEILLAKGVGHVIITLGSQGAFYSNGEEEFMVPAPKVEAVDTTAAGDVFNGALVVALARNYAWREAINYAVKAASIAVTRDGSTGFRAATGGVVTTRLQLIPFSSCNSSYISPSILKHTSTSMRITYVLLLLSLFFCADLDAQRKKKKKREETPPAPLTMLPPVSDSMFSRFKVA